MLRRLVEALVILITLAVVVLLGAARVWHEPGTGVYWQLAELAHMPKETVPIDFVALQRRTTPSDALVCPERQCQKAKADVTAPVFPVPAAELRKKVSLVALAEPNSIELPCVAGCGMAGQFIEYSPVFQFPDVIDVAVTEAGAHASTLAIYSRSVIAIGDWGVNAARAQRWLAALQRIMPRQ